MSGKPIVLTNDTDRERDILARLNNAAEALRDTLDMFVDNDLDSADLVIVHNIDYARTALDAATSYLTDLREQRPRALDAEATNDA
jgi:hypothetical protein